METSQVRCMCHLRDFPIRNALRACEVGRHSDGWSIFRYDFVGHYGYSSVTPPLELPTEFMEVRPFSVVPQ